MPAAGTVPAGENGDASEVVVTLEAAKRDKRQKNKFFTRRCSKCEFRDRVLLLLHTYYCNI